MKKSKRNIKQFGRFMGKYGGYSLVETLMVVLIIGILTAVALPQYQRAVAKAEYARAQVAVATLARAEDIYYETYKQYTPVMENLDVTIDFTSQTKDCSEESSSCAYSSSKRWGSCSLYKNGIVFCRTTKDTLRYYKYATNHSSARAGKSYCRARKDGADAPADDWTYKFCQRETGKTTPSNGLFEYVK